MIQKLEEKIRVKIGDDQTSFREHMHSAKINKENNNKKQISAYDLLPICKLWNAIEETQICIEKI